MPAHIYNGQMVKTYKTAGWGLSPGSTPCQPYNNVNLNILKPISITRTNAWRASWAGIAKVLDGGGPGFKSGGLHKILNNTQTNSRVPRGSPRLGHVAPHNLPNTMPCVTNRFTHNLPINECHVSGHTSAIQLCHIIIRTCHISICTDCTDCTVSIPFFTCLTIRTDHDISRSQCLFEMKRVALGL
jgi:hypothetical protein